VQYNSSSCFYFNYFAVTVTTAKYKIFLPCGM